MQWGIILDDTKWKIMNATIELIKDKGYTATTTKDIANQARVNECTIFRKFKSKKDIVLSALDQKDWRPNLTKDTFDLCHWDLKIDLEMFSTKYLENVTPDFVKLSIGLRAPQIYDDVSNRIMKIPEVFKETVQEYFEIMYHKNKVIRADFDCLATMFLSLCFGFVYLKASFENQLIEIENSDYIQKSVAVFIKGIEEK